ncbi:MAG: hypothetical protein J3K34DRAFT_463492 [Monoraphidium minutum]|nr:MAG: hypothetical protein J3K34DRAFT_463492 [Monoraphidium minutum]
MDGLQLARLVVLCLTTCLEAGSGAAALALANLDALLSRLGLTASLAAALVASESIARHMATSRATVELELSDDPGKVGAVIGDVHGDLTPVITALQGHARRLGPGAVSRALRAPGTAGGCPPKLLLLGDYVDRGDSNAKCVLVVLSAKPPPELFAAAGLWPAPEIAAASRRLAARDWECPKQCYGDLVLLTFAGLRLLPAMGQVPQIRALIAHGCIPIKRHWLPGRGPLQTLRLLDRPFYEVDARRPNLVFKTRARLWPVIDPEAAADALESKVIVAGDYRGDLSAVPAAANWARRLAAVLRCVGSAAWCDPAVWKAIHDGAEDGGRDGAVTRALVSRAMLAEGLQPAGAQFLFRGHQCFKAGINAASVAVHPAPTIWNRAIHCGQLLLTCGEGGRHAARSALLMSTSCHIGAQAAARMLASGVRFAASAGGGAQEAAAAAGEGRDAGGGGTDTAPPAQPLPMRIGFDAAAAAHEVARRAAGAFGEDGAAARDGCGLRGLAALGRGVAEAWPRKMAVCSAADADWSKGLPRGYVAGAMLLPALRAAERVLSGELGGAAGTLFGSSGGGGGGGGVDGVPPRALSAFAAELMAALPQAAVDLVGGAEVPPPGLDAVLPSALAAAAACVEAEPAEGGCGGPAACEAEGGGGGGAAACMAAAAMESGAVCVVTRAAAGGACCAPNVPELQGEGGAAVAEGASDVESDAAPGAPQSKRRRLGCGQEAGALMAGGSNEAAACMVGAD